MFLPGVKAHENLCWHIPMNLDYSAVQGREGINKMNRPLCNSTPIHSVGTSQEGQDHLDSTFNHANQLWVSGRSSDMEYTLFLKDSNQ